MESSVLDRILLAVILLTTEIPGGQCNNTTYYRGKNRSPRSDCSDLSTKKSFPNLDYALLGYNIIKGYPQSFGHDPGFTRPIFKADYSTGKQSADCRYNVPDGYLTILDISCQTSFESRVFETTYEFYTKMSSSVEVGLSLPIFSFGASHKYKEATSILSSGKFIYIISDATCRYYYAQLDTDNPPDFSSGFIQWATALSKSNDKNIYMNFFDRFGTHFPIELVFGGQYIYQHKMESSKYKTKHQNGVDVEVSASLYGDFNINGGVSLSNSQRELASKFHELVSTEVMVKGATPPSNGKALSWASKVQENPVPIRYKLVPIEDLFTNKYMSALDIDYTTVSINLKNYSQEYCRYLQDNGYVDSCEDNGAEVVLTATRLWSHYYEKDVKVLQECITHCKETLGCYALSYVLQEKISKGTFTCFLFNDKATGAYGTYDTQWESILFQKSRTSNLTFSLRNTNIGGKLLGDPPKTMSKELCEKSCFERVNCAGFSICNCSGVPNCRCASRRHTCKLFSHRKMDHLYKDDATTTYILLRHVSR